MTRKQWAALSLSLLALGIGGTIAAVAIVDPFEVYHKATLFTPQSATARRSIPTPESPKTTPTTAWSSARP